jgi:hypothetical protein
MKLFYAPGSSSLLPHIVLYEVGLPFVAVRINEHSKVIEGGGDFRNVNPLGYVPALVLDDGTLLTEGSLKALDPERPIREADITTSHLLAARPEKRKYSR